MFQAAFPSLVPTLAWSIIAYSFVLLLYLLFFVPSCINVHVVETSCCIAIIIEKSGEYLCCFLQHLDFLQIFRLFDGVRSKKFCVSWLRLFHAILPFDCTRQLKLHPFEMIASFTVLILFSWSMLFSDPSWFCCIIRFHDTWRRVHSLYIFCLP